MNNHLLKRSHTTGFTTVFVPHDSVFWTNNKWFEWETEVQKKLCQTNAIRHEIALKKPHRAQSKIQIGTSLFNQNLKYNMHIRRNTHGRVMVMRLLRRNSVRNKNSLENVWNLLLCLLSWYAPNDDLKEWQEIIDCPPVIGTVCELLSPLKLRRSTVWVLINYQIHVAYQEALPHIPDSIIIIFSFSCYFLGIINPVFAPAGSEMNCSRFQRNLSPRN